MYTMLIFLLLNCAYCLFTHLNFKFLPKRFQKYTANCLNQAQLPYYMKINLAQLFENFTLSEAHQKTTMIGNFVMWLKNSDVGTCLKRTLKAYQGHIDQESISYFLKKKKLQINQTIQKVKTEGIEAITRVLQEFIKLVDKESQFTYLQLFFYHFSNSSSFFEGVSIEDCIEEDTVGLLSELLNEMDKQNYKRLLIEFYTKFKFLQLRQHCRQNLFIIIRKAQFVKCSMLYDLDQRQISLHEAYFNQMAIQPASIKAKLLAQFFTKKISQDCPDQQLQLQIQGLQLQNDDTVPQEGGQAATQQLQNDQL